MYTILKTLGSFSEIYGPIIYNDECIYDPNGFYDKYKVKLDEMVKYIDRTDSIVEFGSNAGYFLSELKSRFNSNAYYLGIDHDATLLTIANLIAKHNNKCNIEFKQDDIELFISTNIIRFDVGTLMNLPYPLQYTDYFINVIKQASKFCRKLFIDIIWCTKYDQMPIYQFELKLSELGTLSHIHTSIDEMNNSANLYLLEI